MNSYPETVGRVVEDYVERVTFMLRGLPPQERDEFVQEIESHVYEAYHQSTDVNDLTRIFGVLRKLGEPADLVSERLPASLARLDQGRFSPLHIVGGLAVAVFALPLGLGGVAVLFGVLVSLAELLICYYAIAGCSLLIGGLLTALGLVRLVDTGLWDRLLAAGYIQFGSENLFTLLAPSGQGIFLMIVAAVFVVLGVGMIQFGKHILRTIRFLSILVFEQSRRMIENLLTKLRSKSGRASISLPIFATGK